MENDHKRRLIDLGAGALADALLALADRDERAANMIERLVATPEEAVKRFKSRLAGLKRSRRFVDWREASQLARDLEDLLRDLRSGLTDPKTGCTLTAAFFETDGSVFGRCDDSSGQVGDVYRLDAKELFGHYAGLCSDKAFVAKLLLKTLQRDDYGVRFPLLDDAADYLPVSDIRGLIEAFQKAADKEGDNFARRSWLGGVESLARQIKDPGLFEKTRIAAWGATSTAARVDIAAVYLECGEPHTALSWLEKIPADEHFKADERDRLLLVTYEQLGDTERQIATARQIFHRRRSIDTLDQLLALIGDDQRNSVMAAEVTSILAAPTLSLADLRFLIDCKQLDAADHYLCDRAGQLDGGSYTYLAPLAKTLESLQRPLAASIVYRALLDSILQKGNTKAYTHGARYLKKLDRMAANIGDWRGLVDHYRYLELLRDKHGRKSSFWSRYDPG